MKNEDRLLKDIFENESSSSLKDLFVLRTNHCNYWLISGECGTWGRFDDLEQKLRSNIAFNLIPTAVEICLNQDDSDLFDTALSLLASLIRASNTTEIPNSLKEEWGQIKLKAEELKSYDFKTLIGHIENWYRKIL